MAITGASVGGPVEATGVVVGAAGVGSVGAAEDGCFVGAKVNEVEGRTMKLETGIGG